MTNEEFIQSIALPGEEWRDVVGYEGLYVVSSLGRVASLNRTVPKNGIIGQPFRRISPRLLCPVLKRDGYFQLILCRNNERKYVHVHRLVAIAFVVNDENKPMVDHIDRNRKNNRANNLRWCTLSENMHNPLTVEHCSALNKGRKKPYQFKAVIALKDGKPAIRFPSIKDAIASGFSGSQISNVCAGRQASHKGYKWMFLSDYESQVSMSKNSTQSSASPTP